LNNPYFGSSARFADANLPALLLVCRLDAPNAATVKRMITDGIAAEQIGLRGFAYVDARGIKDPGLSEGDKWLLNLAADARRRGTPVILDNGEGLFPVAYPMRNASLYFGWYAENVTGPMVRPDFRFRAGAIVRAHPFVQRVHIARSETVLGGTIARGRRRGRRSGMSTSHFFRAYTESRRLSPTPAGRVHVRRKRLEFRTRFVMDDHLYR
jgi:hypothetical protein